MDIFNSIIPVHVVCRDMQCTCLEEDAYETKRRQTGLHLPYKTDQRSQRRNNISKPKILDEEKSKKKMCEMERKREKKEEASVCVYMCKRERERETRV